jgi:hypothetical protein
MHFPSTVIKLSIASFSFNTSLATCNFMETK